MVGNSTKNSFCGSTTYAGKNAKTFMLSSLDVLIIFTQGGAKS